MGLPIPMASLGQVNEILNIDPRLLQDMGESGSFHGTVGGNSQLESLHGCMLLESDVTALLSHDHPPITLQRTDDLVIRQTRDFAHTASSMNSALGAKSQSSSTGSR